MPGYIINSNIFFDPATCTMHNIKDPSEVLTLNAISSRCLTALLDERGIVLSREILLEKGWGASGIIVASNSLNQTISQLRKAFRQLGELNDIITTVSREGYRITVAINVKVVDFQPNIDNFIPELIGKRNIKPWKVVLFLFFSFLTILTVLFIFLFKNYKSEDGFYLYAKGANPGIAIYYQSSLRKKTQYLETAKKKLTTDPDLINETSRMKYVYVNNTVRNDVFSYFICTGIIYGKDSSCNSFILVEDI